MRHLILPVIIFMALPLCAQSKGTAGDITIIPTRVVLEGRDRSAEVVLRNSGQQACVYRISFQEMQMTPAGTMEIVPKEEGTVMASDLIRFSPKQIEIPAGKSQTVRIQLRKPEGLADGEYRSHMVFQAMPPVEPPKPTSLPDDNKNVYFDLKTLTSLAIPVIVRHGETTAAIDLSGISFHPSTKPNEAPSLDLTLGRKGNRSVQGDFKVDWVPSSGKTVTVLPTVTSVIYANLDSRSVHLILDEAKGLAIKQGKFKLTYSFKDMKQQPVVAFLDVP